MSTFPMGANKPIEGIEATLLAATKLALHELVWWAHATMAAKAAETLQRCQPLCGPRRPFGRHVDRSTKDPVADLVRKMHFETFLHNTMQVKDDPEPHCSRLPPAGAEAMRRPVGSMSPGAHKRTPPSAATAARAKRGRHQALRRSRAASRLSRSYGGFQVADVALSQVCALGNVSLRHPLPAAQCAKQAIARQHRRGNFCR